MRYAVAQTLQRNRRRPRTKCYSSYIGKSRTGLCDSIFAFGHRGKRLDNATKIRGRAAAVFSSSTRTSSSTRPNIGTFRMIDRSSKDGGKGKSPLVRAGLPFVLFSILASWVVKNAIDGKLREREAAFGLESKSVRQAAMEKEHDDMMERMEKIVSQDFDNTKRIKRPEEILEERRKEREERNRWYNRAWRLVAGEEPKR